MSIENTYKQLTQIEHILHRPDTYIGSLNKTTTDAYVIDPETLKIIKRSVTYSPAFLKIFDEVLTNASDQCQREGTNVSYIKVNVNDAGKISIENDGKSLPIEIHKDAGCYVPEMTFTRLLTGSNYNDDEERYGAGRNGLGSKLANIYSSKFIIETADGRKSYKQICTENMNVISEPEIGISNSSMTRITFYPEFHRFKMDGLEVDALSLMMKRTLDVAAYNPGINVYFNNRPLTVKSFEQYVRLHVGDDEEIFVEKLNDRFELAVTKSSTGQFEQVSIVNGVSTFEGGTHTYWASYNIANTIYDSLAKGKRIKMKWQDVKNNMMVFLKAKVPNPQFPSQTKEKLTSPMTKEVLMGAFPSDKFLKKIQKSEIVEELLRQIDARDKADLSKMIKPISNGRIKIEKLEDANRAGTKDSMKCSLLLAEGDCLDATTLIKVLDGEGIHDKMIKDVNVGDLVLTHKLNFKPVIQTTSKLNKTIKISAGKDVIVCSKEHVLPVYDKDDMVFRFIKAESIVPGRHMFLKSKFRNMLRSEKFISITPGGDYDFILKTESHELQCTKEHKFMVYDVNNMNFISISANDLDMDDHQLMLFEGSSQDDNQ